jgi:hypothetical protein
MRGPQGIKLKTLIIASTVLSKQYKEKLVLILRSLTKTEQT